MLKPMNIQLFAEGGEAQNLTPPAPAVETPAGKTFSEDYVSTLRNESAGYRTKAKTYEGTLRSLLGVKEEEEIGDLNTRLTSYQQTQQSQQAAALEAVNKRLVQAEMRSLEGYNLPLLERLIDQSKITVGDDGAVAGLKEAAEETAKQFPEVIRKTPPPFSKGAKGPSAAMESGKEKANAALRAALRKD